MKAQNTAPKKPVQTKTLALISVLVLFVIGILYWLYIKLEWEEKEIDLGYSKEAKQNDFLAAEIFLRKHGIQATSVKNLSLLDNHRWRGIELGPDDTVILINANKTLTQDRYDSLYEWVENGGTLITSTQNPYIGTHTDKQDLLLRDFGIIPIEDSKADKPLNFFDRFSDDEDEKEKEKEKNDSTNKEKQGNTDTVTSEEKTDSLTDENNASAKKSNKKSTKKEKQEHPENYYRCNLRTEPVEIEFDKETAPLRFDFSHRTPFFYYSYDESDNEYSDEGHTDDEYNNDEYIREDDSAEENNHSAINDGSDIENTIADADTESDADKEYHLLYFEVGEGGITVTSDNYIWSNRRIDCHDHAYALWSLVNPNGRVWFLTNQDAPSLIAIIWHYAKYAVFASVLALIFWLWNKGSRFGPVFTVEHQGRRSLAEHIHASAMLLWRKQQHPQLVKLLRTEILERIDQQHPQLHGSATNHARIELIHQLTNLKESEIHHALFAEDLSHPQAFSTAIAHLQLIRKQL